MEHQEEELLKSADAIVDGARKFDMGVNPQMYSSVRCLAQEGIGVPIYLERTDAKEGEENTLIGIALPCNEPTPSNDLKVAVAFTSGDVFIIKPPENTSRRNLYYAMFTPGDSPLIAQYKDADTAQKALMYSDLPHRKKNMKASTNPSHAQKVAGMFFGAIDYARALKDAKDDIRAQIVGYMAVSVLKLSDPNDSDTMMSMEFTPEN